MLQRTGQPSNNALKPTSRVGGILQRPAAVNVRSIFKHIRLAGLAPALAGIIIVSAHPSYTWTARSTPTPLSTLDLLVYSPRRVNPDGTARATSIRTMSTFDHIRFAFSTFPAEQRLAMLHTESVRVLSMIHGHALLLHPTSAASDAHGESDRRAADCDAIVAYVRELRAITAALAHPHQHTDLGSAELAPFARLLDAIKSAAAANNSALAAAIDDPHQLMILQHYPLVVQNAPPFQRQIMLILTGQRYRVDLDQWNLSGAQPILEPIRQVSCTTLIEVVQLMEYWLLHADPL
jgi:hypothetical protein